MEGEVRLKTAGSGRVAPFFGGRFERNNGEWDGIRKANVAHGDAWKNEDQVDEQMRFHPANHARLVALRGKRRSWREPSSPWARFKGPEATRLVGEDPSQERGRQISMLFNCEKRNSAMQVKTNYRRLAQCWCIETFVASENSTWFKDARGHSSPCLSKLLWETSNEKSTNSW